MRPLPNVLRDAERILELAEKAELEPDEDDGREWSVSVQEEGDLHGQFTVVEHDDGHEYEILVQGKDGSGDDVEFAAACSLLAPALARDLKGMAETLSAAQGALIAEGLRASDLTSLLADSMRYWQHDPLLADRARAVGLLPPLSEDVRQRLRERGGL